MAGGRVIGNGGLVQQPLVLKSESVSQNMSLLDQWHCATETYVDRDKSECLAFVERQWISGFLKKQKTSRKLNEFVFKEKSVTRDLT